MKTETTPLALIEADNNQDLSVKSHFNLHFIFFGLSTFVLLRKGSLLSVEMYTSKRLYETKWKISL